jgi:hypothetical protein
VSYLTIKRVDPKGNNKMRKLISFEEEGKAEIKMEGINPFFVEVVVKLNCYYDHDTKSFTPPSIKFKFIPPLDEKILEEISEKCKYGKQFKIVISKPEEYPKILEGCVLDPKDNRKGSAISLSQTRI